LALLAWVLAAVARALVTQELARGFGKITPNTMISEHLRRVMRQIPAQTMFLAARAVVLVRLAARVLAGQLVAIRFNLETALAVRLVLAQVAIQISLGLRQALDMGRSIDRRSPETSHILQPA
jgi:hypothetical protein